MFIGSIRNPMQKIGDGSFFFFGPFCQLGYQTGRLSTGIFRKPSNTNIGLKPQSCQNPRIVEASFKGELCRCYRLCKSTEQTKKEIQFTLDLYEDNGHDRAKLKKIADA